MDDPLIDIIGNDFRGLPPVFLATGGAEVIASDVDQFAIRAKEAGVEVLTETSEGMQHLYFFMVGKAPEADKTMHSAAEFLKQKLGLLNPETRKR